MVIAKNEESQVHEAFHRPAKFLVQSKIWWENACLGRILLSAEHLERSVICISDLGRGERIVFSRPNMNTNTNTNTNTNIIWVQKFGQI